MAIKTIRQTIAIPCPSPGIARHAENSNVSINLTGDREIPHYGRR
jgi:hypothetical protein